MKATRAVVQIGSFTVDGFMLPDGSYRMSQSQAANCIGRPEINARRFLESRLEGNFCKLVEVNKSHVGRGATRIQAVSLDQAVEYWQYQSRIGNQKAFALLTQLSRNTTPGLDKFRGIQVVRPARQQSKQIEAYEKWYVQRLQEQLGGEIEVPTPAGTVDLVTATQLIEVKDVRNWKAAIGQVLVYGDYFPYHQRRIHLFENCKEPMSSIIEQHCQKQKIILTWEI
jgi:hypothetical protein